MVLLEHRQEAAEQQPGVRGDDGTAKSHEWTGLPLPDGLPALLVRCGSILVH